MAKKKKKIPLRTQLRRLATKADKALSLYIRAKTAIDFNGKCPFCKINPIQACFHFVRRRRKVLRWDERNVVGSCHKDNYLEYRDPDPYRAWYIRHNGQQKYLDLVDESSKSFEPTVEFLQNMVDIYTKKLIFLLDKSNEADTADSK